MTEPPPTFRLPHNATDEKKRRWDEQMRAWLADEIDRQNLEDRDSSLDVDEILIRLARAGRPELLRQRYPQFADCIYSPPLRRGQKYPKQKEVALVKIAADFARRIRALWQKRYGEKNRKRGEKSAEHFAIDILRDWYEDKDEAARLTHDAVIAAAKPSGKHRPRRKSRVR